MALEIAAVPVLTGEASDRFDQMMEQSEQRRGSVISVVRLARLAPFSRKQTSNHHPQA